MPVARANAGFGARWTGLPPIVAPRAVALPQGWGQPKLESTRPLIDNGRRRAEELRNSPELSRASTAGAQTPLEGVNPTWERAQVGQPFDREAETRILIERGVLGRVPETALAPPAGGLRPRSFGSMASTRSLGDRRFFRPLVGVHTLPYGSEVGVPSAFNRLTVKGLKSPLECESVVAGAAAKKISVRSLQPYGDANAAAVRDGSSLDHSSA